MKLGHIAQLSRRDFVLAGAGLLASAFAAPAFAGMGSLADAKEASKAASGGKDDAGASKSAQRDSTAADTVVPQPTGTVEILGSEYDNLADALEVANQNGGGTITLHGDVYAANESGDIPTLGFRTSITITSDDGGPYSVFRRPGTNDPLVIFTDGTVKVSNITFDGTGDTAGAPLIVVSDQAVVTLGDGVTLANNTTDGSAYGKKYAASAVALMGKDAQLTLGEGCTIRDNAGVGEAVQAAIFANDGKVRNEGATFEGNTVEATDTPNAAGDAKFRGEDIPQE